MIEYPPKPIPQTGQFKAEVFPAIASIPVPGKQGDDTRSSPVAYEPQGSTESRVLRPAVKIEFGVNKVWVEGSGKSSPSYNNGVNGAKRRGGAEGFHFAPGKDAGALSIRWEVHHPHFIQSARLELYCRSRSEPIWSQNWGGFWGDGKPIAEFISRTKTDGVKKGSLPWAGNIKLPKDLFAAEILTVARSPYQLKLMVSARATRADGEEQDVYGYPLVAWTHLNVLVHKLKLLWGKPEAIPRERTDIQLITKHFQDRGMDKSLTEMLDREKRVLSKLRTKSVTEDQDVVLEAGVFAYDAYAPAVNEMKYYRDMWGDGPFVPLGVSVTVKDLADTDSGVRDPGALGDLDFLWDWQDNVGETRKQRLDAWLGLEGDPPDQRATRITRYFLEETWKRFAPDAYPRHAYNCPATLGGKRGAQAPRDANQAAVVFPDWAAKAPFPFKVRSATTRIWASISTAAAAEVTDVCDEAVDTGVLFQPAAIAGDRYKVSVYAMPWTDESPDQDKQGASCYDLSVEAAALPHASTGLYTMWRSIKATYYASQSFYPGIDPTLTAIKDRLKKELGFITEIEKKPFPDLQGQLDGFVEKTIVSRTEFQTASKALILLTAFAQLAVRDPDYAFDVIDGTNNHWDKIHQLFQTGTVQAIAANGALRGKAIKGNSGARGVVLTLPADYQSRDYDLVLLLNGQLADGEEITELTTAGTKQNVQVLASQPLFAETRSITVTAPTSHKQTSREINLQLTNTTVAAALDYKEGFTTPTRHLNTTRKADVDTFINDVKAAYAGAGLVDIKIQAKNTDTRQQARVTELETYLDSKIIERSKLETEFWTQTVSMLGAGNLKKGLEKFCSDAIRPAFRGLFNAALLDHAKRAPENANWQTEGRTIFYHLRGRTELDPKFTTGGIENNYCEEKFGISGLTVPALNAGQRVEKRWLKDPIVVAVHEFGHSLFLKHARQRFFDSKTAPGVTRDHLAHDTCLMNYDADSSAFCGVCILRKRGWAVDANLITQALGQEDGGWGQKCMDLMEADVQNLPRDATVHVRLAMYKLYSDKYAAGAVDVNAAKGLMTTAETLVPTAPADNEKRVWMLRNLVIFHRNLLADGKSTQLEVDRYVRLLKATSDLPLDIDVETAQNLGVWSNAP